MKPVDGNELDKSLYTFLPENLIRKRSNEEYFEAEMKKHTISEKEDKEKLLDREIGLAYCKIQVILPWLKNDFSYCRSSIALGKCEKNGVCG